jgi:selenocysteine lyase/cysteine desulfurase
MNKILQEECIMTPVLDRFLEIHHKIRSRFPQIEQDVYGNKRIYLNSGAGTLMVDFAIHALANKARSSNPQPGDIDPAEIATDLLHWRVRQFVADFIHAGKPEEISFHFSTTHALFNLAYSLRTILTKENNLVVTDLDHMANISPWEDMWGLENLCQIRRAKVNAEGCLDVDHLLSLIDEKTGLVAVTMASNGFGSLVPLKEIIPLVRKKSDICLICVDAVHHALHGPIDVQELDCDFLAFSGYKLFGPVLGVLWGKADLLRRLNPYRVETNEDELPYKFEQGTLNNAVLASLEGALEYLLWLSDELAINVEQEIPSRRDKLRFVMNAIAEYEGKLSQLILEGFQRFDPDKFRCYGITNPERVLERDSTFSFEIRGKNPREIKRYLWEEYGFQIGDGNHYSAAIYRHLGRDSMCRASFAHYDTLQTGTSFVEALESLLN